ncbi:hypothetical protein [Nocardiopsis potens]|uniref:hypothetical protein n=1 Tax=Nocardiopsis potens TaxID=1246458 RepID=UPI00037DE9E6|nr:hypothetical protein [Nocardiopsis potens]
MDRADDADPVQVLRHEFEAREGSFLIRLRGDLVWGRAAFTRLERAMRAVCERCEGAELLERWLAEGFHEMGTWVRDWSTHPAFPRPTPESYHSACLERLEDLADWFFRGEHAYLPGYAWPEL